MRSKTPRLCRGSDNQDSIYGGRYGYSGTRNGRNNGAEYLNSNASSEIHMTNHQLRMDVSPMSYTSPSAMGDGSDIRLHTEAVI